MPPSPLQLGTPARSGVTRWRNPPMRPLQSITIVDKYVHGLPPLLKVFLPLVEYLAGLFNGPFYLSNRDRFEIMGIDTGTENIIFH